MKNKKIQSHVESPFPNIDLLLEDIKERAKLGKMSPPEKYAQYVRQLDAVNQVCREMYEKGCLNFSGAQIIPILRQRGFFQDRKLGSGPYKRITDAWAKATQSLKREAQVPTIVSPFPHINLLIENIKMNASRGDLINSEKFSDFVNRLETVNQVCLEFYERGELNFSGGVIFPILRQRGFPKNLAIGTSYTKVIEAWRSATGGVKVKPDQLSRAKDQETIITYVNGCHERFGRIPDYAQIKAEGYVARRNVVLTPSRVSKDIASAIKKWEMKKKSELPEDIVEICEKWFIENEAVPSVQDVVAFGRQTRLRRIDIETAIDKWRRVRFAMEVYRCEPATGDDRYVWLELHPELCVWRPIILRFQPSFETPSKLRTFRVAIFDFLIRYLLAQKLPLSPKEFLRKGFCEAPCLHKICWPESTSEWARKKWMSVNRTLEFVLSSWEGFVEIDEHGHRLRLPDYYNPLPPYPGRSMNPHTFKRGFQKGTYLDLEMKYMTDQNPGMERWRVFAVESLGISKAHLGGRERAVRLFLLDYIIGQKLPVNPEIFLSAAWNEQNKLPSLIDTVMIGIGSSTVKNDVTQINGFIDHVLETHFSAEDDYGRRVVSGNYCNPLRSLNDEVGGLTSLSLTKSNKRVLPSRYIKYLKEILIPEGSDNFSDLKWAHNAIESDWFEVPSDMIDKSDPDCVWRMRTVVRHELDKQGYYIPKSWREHKIWEIWSPARTIAMLIKLELPLRTYQVRMLDSGEADTWRYVGSFIEKNSKGQNTYQAGRFIKNTRELVHDVGTTERHSGFFRRMPDAVSGKIYTGLYISTNKTADRNKEQWNRGYEVPWQHAKVLYWCERLRDWQEKYNPIDSPVPCVTLPRRVLGPKSDQQKVQMGSMCFLFRNASARDKREENKAWPLSDGSLNLLWCRLLIELENVCAEKGHTTIDGARLVFVPGGRSTGSIKTFYPLHSLRVSLITHLATEGGVEMHILSECIAGHARIIMTLYYKKSGITHVSEAMDEASKKIENKEQDSYIRWLRDASLAQLEMNGACVDASVFKAIKDTFNNGGASLMRTNLGLCAKGGQGCHDGGVSYDENTGELTYGEVPGPPEKNCVRCRWFMTGPAFLQALVHHWNILHFNLGDNGHRYLELEQEIAELESALLGCQKLNMHFERESRLEELRHVHAATYDGNEKLAADSIATMKLIVRCKKIVDAAKDHESGIHLVAVGGMEEVEVNIRECSELEQVLHASAGATIYAQPDVSKAVGKAGNAFDRMLVMNGKDPVFFKLSEKELPVVVSHAIRLMQAHTGSIGRAVPFIEGTAKLSQLGLFGDTDELLNLASAGIPLRLTSRDERGPMLAGDGRKIIPLQSLAGEV